MRSNDKKKKQNNGKVRRCREEKEKRSAAAFGAAIQRVLRDPAQAVATGGAKAREYLTVEAVETAAGAPSAAGAAGGS